MMRFTGLALSLIATQAVGQDGRPPMSPMMDRAMRVVEKTCMGDVQSLCSFPHSEGMMTLRSDPAMEWLMNPSSPIVVDESFSHVLNSMIDSAVRLANEQPTYVLISLEEQQQEMPPGLKTTASDQVFDSMVSKLVEHVASSSSDEPEEGEAEDEDTQVEAESGRPVWDPVAFSKVLAEHGQHIMEQAQAEGDEDRHRLARRLTEVHPGMFHGQGRHPYLPFGCGKNRCLLNAYEEGAVSPMCADALREVERLNELEVSEEAKVVEREQQAFLGLAILYGILCIGTLLLLHRRLSKLGRKIQSRRRLVRRILQAIYSNPELKAAVAADLNEDLGYVPPLPVHVLNRMSGREPTYSWKFGRILKLAAIVCVLVLAFVNPFLAMPVMCILIGTRFLALIFCPPKAPKQECSCCCCGASTDDVAAGNLTAAQECCTCCKSTGVCSPKCAACCGDDGSGCCGKGCCCCGATEKDAAAGNLTKVQACCCCCNGTGVCSGAGGCCCGGDGCCCPDKAPAKRPVRHAKKTAYQGIPVQVV